MPVINAPCNHQSGYTGYMSAPGDLVRLDHYGDPADLVVGFLNTLDVEAGSDALDSMEGWQSWLAAHGLDGSFEPESADTLRQARDLRDDLRTLAAGGRLAEVRRLGIQVALSAVGGVELSAETAAGLIAAAAVRTAIEQRLERIKICPADSCRWAFYDTSRNRSRQWCSMEVCGNRAKARAHRARSAPA
jgi:hypothetical protein